MAANEKDQVLSVVFGLTDELNESRRIPHAARGVEENLACTRMPGEKVKAGGNNLAHIAGRVAAASLDKFRSNGVRMRVARFTDVIDEELQTGLLNFHQYKRKVIVLRRICHPLLQLS